MAGVASYFCILYTLNLALYLLKALAFPNPGSIKPQTLSLYIRRVGRLPPWSTSAGSLFQGLSRVTIYPTYLPGLFSFNSIE